MPRKLTTEEFILKAKEIHGDRYGYDNVVYINNSTDVEIFCDEHGFFRQRPHNHLLGKGCKYCQNKSEGEIFLYLKDLCDVHREYKINGSNYRYDFYLPEYNLLIERDGEQHYPKFHHRSNFSSSYTKQYMADIDKTNLAKKNHFRIARIPYWLSRRTKITKKLKIEIYNILSGKPSYPDIPDPDQELTKPGPIKSTSK